jgi:membrane protein implicated in regulation of membrane protease activity
MNRMKTRLATPALFLALAAPAEAYVGPGAGISLLGALWALVAAVGAALVFVVAWPIRRMLRKSRARRAAGAPSRAQDRLEAGVR